MAPDPHRQRVIAEISEALTQLLGRDISVAPAGSPEPTELVVRYVDGSGDLVSAWTLEKGLAFSLGGALMMVPRSIVDEAIKSGTETAQLEENFREVVNVLATTAANVLQRRAVLE